MRLPFVLSVVLALPALAPGAEAWHDEEACDARDVDPGSTWANVATGRTIGPFENPTVVWFDHTWGSTGSAGSAWTSNAWIRVSNPVHGDYTAWTWNTSGQHASISTNVDEFAVTHRDSVTLLPNETASGFTQVTIGTGIASGRWEVAQDLSCPVTVEATTAFDDWIPMLIFGSAGVLFAAYAWLLPASAAFTATAATFFTTPVISRPGGAILIMSAVLLQVVANKARLHREDARRAGYNID